ncbi:HypC/HybG/HupF family hydrogenase formation chaperone [Ruminiclostridium papyrosolvens]|uniref:Hydrogenase assembly protein HypC n=1 Tax=Ruminiclostridium papyrosolvens C7 TaxID=1330534 RepID=U4QXA1_9FIRM|nr:HypC/HybG/HupF family hydrogenase formation chaperone [Ruminiclostridium papyrosolvens]EPR08239.1 hydrogenase assembly protein HypC [Ruminiclostridium papyrosolvens C7]
MCLGLPAKVVSIDGNSSNVEMMGVTNKVSIELLDNVQVGDYVLVHAGCAIQVLDEEEALRTIDIFNEIKELGIK